MRGEWPGPGVRSENGACSWKSAHSENGAFPRDARFETRVCSWKGVRSETGA